MPTGNPLDYLYDEDVSGFNPDNKVVNELHLVTTAIEAGDFNLIVPKFMPYFRDTVSITHVTTGRVLIRGIDWQPGHVFESASHQTEWIKGGIYGTILLMDRNLTGEFRINQYQTLGGEWVLSNNKVLEILTARLIDPRTKTYEEVANVPHVFPPIQHNHPIEDWTGFSEAVVAIDALTLAVNERTAMWLDNPPILMSQYYLKQETDSRITSVVDSTVDAKVDAAIVPINASINNLADLLTSGLATRWSKTESDSRYYQKTETYSRAEIDAKDIVLRDRGYSKTESDTRYYPKSVVYVKTEVDAALTALAGTVYTKTASDANYYNKSVTYTKAEVDGLISILDDGVYTKAEVDDFVSTLNTAISTVDDDKYSKAASDGRYYNKSVTYTQTEVDAALTALAGTVYTKTVSDGRYYKKTETYTKAETDSKVTAAVDVLSNDVYRKSETYTQAESNEAHYSKSETYSQSELATILTSYVTTSVANLTYMGINQLATATKVGGIKMRLEAGVLYINNDGADA